MVDRVDTTTIWTKEEIKGIGHLVDDYQNKIDYPLVFGFDFHSREVHCEDLATLYFMLRQTPNDTKYFPTSKAIVMNKLVDALDKEYQVEVAMEFHVKGVKRK